jgi:amidase
MYQIQQPGRSRPALALWLAATLVLAPPAAAAAVAEHQLAPTSEALPFDLVEADIAAIHAAFDAGTLTAEALTQAYLDRIAAYDQSGPAINSLITINTEALAEARVLDEQRAEQGAVGPLHGIPVLIKDNYNTKDLPTTGGSVALARHRPADDAFTVRKLREAGAVVLGKTNMSELALSYGWLGYSSVGGMTLNPYHLGRNASGSSAGSGAAVAAGFAVIGTGTDTAGSIRGPASVTGTVGVKPTLGLTSRAGVIPAALSLDVTGPMARTVRDAALALGVMAGVDPDDPRTAASAEWQVSDYASSLDAGALAGARIGVVRDFTGANTEVDAAFDAALAELRAQGAVLGDIDLPRFIREAWSTMMGRIVDTEFRDQIEAYFDNSGAPVRTLEAVVEISESSAVKRSATPVNPARIEGYREALASRGVADLFYLNVLSQRTPAARRAMEERMREEKLDALVFPTLLCPASPLYDKPAEGYVCNAPDPYAPSYLGSTTGFPEVTVPMGFTAAGLPMGISFFGMAYSEPRLLAFAYAYEQVTQHRRPPESVPPLR